MTQAENHVKWCLNKSKKELRESDKHRGLVKITPDSVLANNHMKKAEHYLKATSYLKEGGFSDISASTTFYAIYHSFLAIAAKFGYESRNQTCTFALMRYLEEEKKIEFDVDRDKIAEMNDESIVDIREKFQYGTSLKMEEEIYEENFEIAKKTVEIAKIEIEK